MDSQPRYSIVVPCYNEEGVLNELYHRIREVMDSTQADWELVLVNDGSRDRTSEIMHKLHSQDDRVKLVEFARNFGHQLAVTAGLDYARGDAVVMIDADLQDPPQVILEMIERWKDGYEVVYAVRAKRVGETWFKEFTAKLFYRIIYRITDVDIPLDTGDFRLMDRKVVEATRQMRERHRFIRGMTSWVGFRQTGVSYVRQERYAGQTHYPFRKMLKFALDAHYRLQLFPAADGYLFRVYDCRHQRAGGTGSNLRPALHRSHALLRTSHHAGDRPFPSVAIQLITLGIIGEYLGRIYDEVKGRPLYIVREALGFNETQNT